MKRIVLTLILVLGAVASIAAASPDVPAAKAALQQALQAQDRADVNSDLLDRSLEVSAREMSKRDAQIADLTQQGKDKDQAYLDLQNSVGVWASRKAILIGTVIGVVGLLILTYGEARSGMKIIGVGITVISFGFAAAKYAPQLGLIGIVVAILGIVVMGILLALDLRKAKQAGDAAVAEHKSAAIAIADGVQQAINAGKIKLDDVRDFFKQAQSGSIAPEIVKEATDTAKVVA